MAQDNKFETIPMISIEPNKINLYQQVIRQGGSYRHNGNANIYKLDNKHDGNLSKAATKKLKKSIDFLLCLSKVKSNDSLYFNKSIKFKVAFITLTLASEQVHSHKVITSQLLNQFLIEAKKKWGVTNYVWRAELQNNGNIHYHILVDKFCPWSEVRDTWNRIQNKLGYVDRYREQMKAFHAGGFKVRQDLLSKWKYKEQILAYKRGKANDWNQPNSTDIHSIKLVKSISSYVSKYMAKNECNCTGIGRLWGCSYELSQCKGAQEVIDSKIQDELSKVFEIIKPKFFTSDFFQCIFVSIYELKKAGCLLLLSIFNNYIQSIYTGGSV